MLTCKLEDFDQWSTSLRDYGFGHGDEYETIIEQGMTGGAQDDPDKDQDNWKSKARMILWIAITGSFSKTVRKKHKRIARGHCEAFIRSVKDEYDHKSETSLDLDRAALSGAKLGSHEDLAALYSFLEDLHARMALHGRQTNKPFESLMGALKFCSEK